MNATDVSASLARHIVQRMGETGQPPERGALAVNVATQSLLEVLREEYLLPMRDAGRNSSFKLVQAPFGGGKSHFLHCLREIAWTEGFATALVGISPEACPFDDTVAIYREVVRSIEMPPVSEEEVSQPGIDVVLRMVLDSKVRAHGDAAVREWLRSELALARIESASIRRAAECFLLAILDGDDDAADRMRAYLLGEDVAMSELSQHRVREALDKKQAFRFLRSIAQLLRVLDVPGLVLLFDEMDRVMSLGAKRKRSIGDNLRQMIDHCGQASLPAVLWIYAVPPEFMTTVVPEYPALEQRLKGSATLSVKSPLAPLIDLDHLSMGAVELFEAIGDRLSALYERAHGIQLDRRTITKNLSALARELGENQFESGTRRTFVKAAVQMISAQHREGTRILSADEIRALANRGVVAPIPTLEDEEDIF